MRVITGEKCYEISSFFDKYYSAPDKLLRSYEPLLGDIKTQLPEYIDTVVIFGCASGRDFTPFQDNYKCIGFDLQKNDGMRWVCDTTNLTYCEYSIEDFMDNQLELTSKLELNWETSLVYTQGTLMYLKTSEVQNNFIDLIANNGCKNMVFHEYTEYPPGLSETARCGGLGWLALNEKNVKLFEEPNGYIKDYRGSNAPIYAMAHLDKNL